MPTGNCLEITHQGWWAGGTRRKTGSRLEPGWVSASALALALFSASTEWTALSTCQLGCDTEATQTPGRPLSAE